MPILKNRTQGNYTMVSQQIMKDRSLGLVERGLLITLLSLPDGWELSNRGLQVILPDGRDRIARTMNRLIEMGYVTRVQGRQGNRFGTNCIEVHETPQLSGDSLQPENTATENTGTGQSCTGSPPQLNTNQLSIQLSNKQKSKPNPFHQYEQHIYDFDELEKALICN